MRCPIRRPSPVGQAPVESSAGPSRTGDEDGHGDEPADDGAVQSLRYEVMYLLEAPEDTIPAFKDVWAGLGDSIVVVGGGGLWNCHIHTDDVGARSRPRSTPGVRATSG